MTEDLHNIDNFFKNPIEEYAEKPSEKVWNDIVNNLDKTSHIILKKRYQNLKKIAAVLLLLLCGTVFYVITKKYQPNISKVEKNNAAVNNITTADTKLPPKTSVNNETTEEKGIMDNTNPETANDLSKQSIEKKSNNKNKISKSKKLIATKKIKISNVEASKVEDEKLLAKKSRTSSKEKMKIKVNNAEASDDYLANLATVENTFLLKSFIVNPEKIEVEKSVFTPVINFRNIPLLMKNGVAKSVGTKNNTGHGFSTTLYVSPEFAFNRLEDDKQFQERMPPPPNMGRPRDDRDKIKREEHKSTSFSAGILVNYAFKNKISLQTGVSFTSKSDEILPKKVFAEQIPNGEIKYKNNSSLGATYIDPKTGTTTLVGDSAILGVTKNTVQYVSIPINILYHFQIKKLQISPMLGIAANFLVKQQVTTNVEGAAIQKINTIEGLNKNYFNANIGVGLDYKLARNFSLSCIPNIKLGLNPVNTNSNVKLYSNTAGIMLGVKYAF